MNSNHIQVFHIGLNTSTYPGTFEWLDGSKNSYRNWVNGSDRTFTGKPLFVSVGVNGWLASDDQTKAHGFVCKYTASEQLIETFSPYV